MTGVSQFYAAGGNGSRGNSGTNNAKSNSTDLTTSRAGCGDGGNGATNGGQAGTSAIANSGSGGGGGGYSHADGGSGGSGVILFKVANSKKPASTTGSPTEISIGDNTVYKFTGDGSAQF